MKGVFFMSTTMSTPSRTRNALQSYVLIGLGVVFLLGALLLRLNPLAFPAGLFLFGIGLLIAAALNPARLMISGLLYTFIGAAIFIAFKPLIPFDGIFVVIASGLALLGIALAARRGYVSAGALTPSIFILLVGLLLYPPTGGAISMLLAPFILSLWFPGIALLLLGLVYWFVSTRRA